jgi:hypothetical protein
LDSGIDPKSCCKICDFKNKILKVTKKHGLVHTDDTKARCFSYVLGFAGPFYLKEKAGNVPENARVIADIPHTQKWSFGKERVYFSIIPPFLSRRRKPELSFQGQKLGNLTLSDFQKRNAGAADRIRCAGADNARGSWRHGLEASVGRILQAVEHVFRQNCAGCVVRRAESAGASRAERGAASCAAAAGMGGTVG